MKPGSVSSSERVPPPMVAAPSMTSTDLPARASVMAAARPFGPDPITIASYELSIDCDIRLPSVGIVLFRPTRSTCEHGMGWETQHSKRDEREKRRKPDENPQMSMRSERATGFEPA